MLNRLNRVLFLSVGLFFVLSQLASAYPIDKLFRRAGDPVAGNPKGTITIVEFFDYQCSHCSNMAPVITHILKDNPEVRVVFKDFPIRGPMSEYAARAAVAANDQGKYYTFNHALLTTRLSFTESNIMDIAKSVGLNIDMLKKEMNSRAVKSTLNATYALANELNLNGTPAFFIGKTNAKHDDQVEFVMGEMSTSELQRTINQAKTA